MAQKSIEGMDALLKKLEQLDNLSQRKALRKGVSQAAALVRKKARDNAKQLDDTATPEQIFKNIKSKNWKSKPSHKYVGASVGVLGGAKGFAAKSGELKGKGKGNAGGDTWYWRFLEFGKQGKAARPFLAPALESEENSATMAIQAGAMKAIDDIAKG